MFFDSLVLRDAQQWIFVNNTTMDSLVLREERGDWGQPVLMAHRIDGFLIGA